MKALSIKQPWAWAILNAGKDVENRDWMTKFRGTVAIHTSQRMSVEEWQEYVFLSREVCNYSSNDPEKLLPNDTDLFRGAILGTVEIVDCVEFSDSPWFFGEFGFVLQNPKKLVEPIYCKGALGFWEVSKEIEAHFKFAEADL